MKLQLERNLPNITATLANRNRRGIGAAGRTHAQRLFEKAGYVVSKASRLQGDLRVTNPATGEVQKIEVKTARRCKDGKWRFLLYKKASTDHTHADQVLLLAVLKSGRVVAFLVPVAELLNQRQAVITSHPETYTGKLARYRQPGGLQSLEVNS